MATSDDDYQFPITKDLPCEVLAAKAAEFCRELASRPLVERERQLQVALKLWPMLKAAACASGIKIGLNGLADPVFPEWAKEPVVCLESHYGPKPKTRAAAEEIAKRCADNHWVTMGELWLLCAGTGPAYERGLAKYGYLPKK